MVFAAIESFHRRLVKAEAGGFNYFYFADGAVFVDLEEQKRLKLRTGLCTKGIYWSQRENGPGWKGYGLGSKELCEEWVEFFQEHPLAV